MNYLLDLELGRKRTLFMKTRLRIGLLVLLVGFTNSQVLLAQNTNAAASAPKTAHATNETAKTPKQPVAGPFHGKLLAADLNAKTISVGKRTFQITSETRMKKAGKPATMAEGVVGEPVSGYVKPGPNGKWIAVSVNFGPKPEEAKAEKKTKPEKEQN